MVQSPFLSLAEGARYVRLRQEAFNRLVFEGLIPSYESASAYAGGRCRKVVDARDLDTWMHSHKIGGR